MDHVLYLAICFFATVVGAVSGIGGGVIIKPAFDLCTGLSASAVSFLSGCTVLAMTSVSLLGARGGPIHMEKRRGSLLGLGAAAGGVLGKLLFDQVRLAAQNGSFVGGTQNFVMILLCLGVFAYVLNKERIPTHDVANPAVCILIGLFLGVAGAFLGIGGGPVNLVVLYFFFSMESKVAALNSLYIIFFSQISSLLSLFASGKIPDFEPSVLCVMVAGGIAGAFLGRGAAKKLSTRQTDRLFLVVLLLILVISGYNVFKFIA